MLQWSKHLCTVVSDTGHRMIFSESDNDLTFNGVRDVAILVNDLGRRITV